MCVGEGMPPFPRFRKPVPAVFRKRCAGREPLPNAPPAAMYRRLVTHLLACCVLLFAAAMAQAAPAAGVVISNTALASFVDTATGGLVRLNSNTVNTRVT